MSAIVVSQSSSSQNASSQNSAVSRLAAPALLLATGALLATTIIFSKLAAAAAAPMLWYLAVIMSGSGAILLLFAVWLGQARASRREWGRILAYGLGAGAFMALPSAFGYLAVAHVGAGFISITFAFPLLLTYAMALLFGMERLQGARAAGVLLGLIGGFVLAFSKSAGAAEGLGAGGWVLLAAAIPVIVALGNLYRTRFWPAGAKPVLLAALMLLLGGLATMPFAAWREGVGAAALLWTNGEVLALVGIAIAVFCLKYVAYFELQRLAGPVYLSQIGSVSAAFGAVAAFGFLGEPTPQGLGVAIGFVAAGMIVFQRATRRSA